MQLEKEEKENPEEYDVSHSTVLHERHKLNPMIDNLEPKILNTSEVALLLKTGDKHICNFKKIQFNLQSIV
ncbi:hypothetical protein BgiMline_036474 [Biomphalaria glabrata]|nr:hypothetical protein BgiMline_014974 [Biomphalaria glabrata]